MAIDRPDWNVTPPSSDAQPVSPPAQSAGTVLHDDWLKADWNAPPKTESQRMLDEIEAPFVNDAGRPFSGTAEEVAYSDADLPARPDRYQLTDLPVGVFGPDEMEPAQNFMKAAHAAGLGSQKVRDAIIFAGTWAPPKGTAPEQMPEVFFHAAIDKAVSKGWQAHHIATAIEHQAAEFGRKHGAEYQKLFLEKFDQSLKTYKHKGR